MPIANQPSKNQGLWVPAYRPIGFNFYQLNYPQPFDAIEADIYFDGALYATIKKNTYNEVAFSIFGLPVYLRMFAIDIQRYAQAYLSPFAGERSAAAPNVIDTLPGTPTSVINHNIKHYCSCYVQVRYLYTNGNGVLVTDPNRKETSERFYIANATLQHYESYESDEVTPTQSLKPFYLNSSAPIKFLTNKKSNIKLKRGVPQTISFIAKDIHAAYYVLRDKDLNVISSGIIPVYGPNGSGSNFHARIGVSDININSFHYWISSAPYPVVNNNVKFIDVILLQWHNLWGIPIPQGVSERKRFEFDDCGYSFQLDYLNPLGGFDSYVFSKAIIKSKIGKDAQQFERTLARAGYSDGLWNVYETGTNDLNISQTETFTVTVLNCDENDLKQLKELQRSPEIYMQLNGQSLPVVIVDEVIDAAGWKTLTNKFTFSFRLANTAIIQRK